MAYELEGTQLEAVMEATEELLASTGFCVQHEELCRRAARAGARVEPAAGLIRLPPPLLRELLAAAPSSYRMRGITGRYWSAGGRERHCLAIVTDPWILDSRTHALRRPALADVRRHTRIAQRLDEVAAISLMDFPVSDVAGPDSSLHALEAHLLEHDKHMMVLAASPERLRRWERLLPVLTTEAPGDAAHLVSAGIAVRSPLTLTRHNGELLLAACASGYPVVPTVCPMAGTTSPFSKAGALLQANAEVVFMAALTQIVEPGHPFLYGLGPSRTDMRSGDDLYYTLDKVLWKTAGGQLGRAYGLPTSAECGGTTAARYDLQSGAEGMLFMQAAWESGAHLLAGLGSCGNAITMSAEMMLVQTTWLRAARFLAAGLEADWEADLASIRRCGPGGHFLMDERTLNLLHSAEFFADPLFDHDGGHTGSSSLLERAHDRADDLAQGDDSPVPERVREELRAFFRREREQTPD